MKGFGGIVAAVTVAGMLLGAAAAPSYAQMPAPAPAPKKQRIYLTRAFDGIWSVSIYTRAGMCPASLRYPAIITNGRVVKADGEFGYDISGAVYSNGAIIVTVSAGGQNATGRGRLNRLHGSGAWVAAGGQCAGIWNADRRG